MPERLELERVPKYCGIATSDHKDLVATSKKRSIRVPFTAILSCSDINARRHLLGPSSNSCQPCLLMPDWLDRAEQRVSQHTLFFFF